METYFVNEAFDKALNDYLISRDKKNGLLYNSFLVVVIRMLINIYGELDIINPYQIKDEDALNSNLRKFGATINDINNLKRLIDGFYKIEKRNNNAIKKEENIYFIEVQKCLIDLFTIKRINYTIDDEGQKEFFDLLYTPGISNELRYSYNYLNAMNREYEVAEYYNEKMQLKSNVENQGKEKDLLGFDVYKQFNISIADISKMSDLEVENLNKKIYEAFDIKENTMNKEYLLKEKMTQLYRRNHPLTTGNGYVDILLIMSVIVTTIMVIVVVSTLT